MTHTATLDIDLAGIAHNWQLLGSQPQGSICAAVVKANAYGLGVEPVAAMLAAQGCTHFFVATLTEAIELRGVLKNADIFVFHGIAAGEAAEFTEHRLIPVINDMAQLERWEKVAANAHTPAMLHVDTGMSRLGMNEGEAFALAEDTARMNAAKIEWLMSHLACAGTPEHPLNADQQARFSALHRTMPRLKASLANSSGIFLGSGFHFDLVRPGCSLYGISPNTDRPNPMRQIATLTAPVIQFRTLEKDQAIGYGATHEARKGTKLATVALGYADGFQRLLSNQFTGYLAGTPVPLVGRVSMDMVIFDVSAVPTEMLTETARVEFIGPHQSVDDVAQQAGTIGYEIFTRIGARVKRNYLAVDK